MKRVTNLNNKRETGKRNTLQISLNPASSKAMLKFNATGYTQTFTTTEHVT